MKCEDAREQLTEYLDGELDGDRGSALRGHLRTCDGCRDAARDEAVLRDGLRTLPPVDPPASLWAGVQARLAAAEMADADKPAWRRTIARWLRPLGTPHLGIVGFTVAAAVGVLAWRWSHHTGVAPPVATSHAPGPLVTPPPAPPAPAPSAPEAQDVTADIAGEPARVGQDLAAATDEMLRLAQEARAQWSAERKQVFDARVAELRHQIDATAEGRKRQGAYRTLFRYLQGAAIRDEVAMSDRTFAGARWGGAR